MPHKNNFTGNWQIALWDCFDVQQMNFWPQWLVEQTLSNMQGDKIIREWGIKTRQSAAHAGEQNTYLGHLSAPHCPLHQTTLSILLRTFQRKSLGTPLCWLGTYTESVHNTWATAKRTWAWIFLFKMLQISQVLPVLVLKSHQPPPVRKQEG